MLIDYIIQHWWPGVVLWACLYIADYRLTLVGAKLARQGEQTISRPGGYELTPEFREDIAELRPHSKKFYGYLVYGGALLVGAWVIFARYSPSVLFYEGLLGAFALAELEVLIRHAQSITSNIYVARRQGIHGYLVTTMWYSLRVSAASSLAFAVLFLVIFALTGRCFFVGGAFASISHARRDWELSKMEDPNISADLLATSTTQADGDDTVTRSAPHQQRQ